MQTTLPNCPVKIKIVGVGGGGTNAVDRMIDLHLPFVDFLTVNTDDTGYQRSKAPHKLQIGLRETKGRGAGADPEKGRCSAEENQKELKEALEDCDLLFLTAGMGGGTGTGAAPVLAKIAQKLGILTVGVVTTPFAFEGKHRKNQALAGIAKLEQFTDATVVIPNDNLKKVAQSHLTLCNAFEIADSVLAQTVKNLVEVIQNTAYINCDFADICSILRHSGRLHTAQGKARGLQNADDLLRQIAANPLLDTSVEKADGILLCITAPESVGLEEIDRITSALSQQASPNANVIFGMNFDPQATDEISAILMATHSNPLPQ